MKCSHKSFVVVETNPAYDGSAAVNRFGYCAACFVDMQSFAHDGKQGPTLRYQSHKRAKGLGLWGYRAKGE